MVIVATLIALVLGAAETAGASESAATPSGVETIVVSGTRAPQPLQKIPASVSVVDRDAIQKARATIGLEESLRRVPGVFVQNSGNYAQDSRLQVRGFGTRAAFGIREITVLVDGLPETLPDGQSQIDTIELSSLQSVEVLRGAGAALYGNAAGGVVHLITQDPPDTPGMSLRATGGSFGLMKWVGQIGAKRNNLGSMNTASYLQSQGYREHSAVRNATVVSRLVWEADARTKLKILLDGAYAPLAKDPGGLTSEQVREDRRQARERNVLLDAGEAVDQIRLGTTLERTFDTGDLAAYAYASYRDFDARLPIVPAAGDGIIQFDRFSPGGGARYSYDQPIYGWAQELTLGVDAQYQWDDRQRFANIEGTKGALGLDQIEEVTGVGVYLREALSITESIEVSGGVRYDAVHYRVDVKTPADSEASGTRLLDAWSPAGGITYTPRKDLTLFGSVSTAFQAPTTTELVNPYGPGFNPDIEPQTARNFEIGLRYQPKNIKLDASLYRIALEDELIPFETPAGRVAFRNAGRSRRLGLEVSWQAELPYNVTWTGSGTALNAKYTEYETDDGNYDGNREPGIPPWFVYQEISYEHESGLHAALEAYLVGGYFVDDANAARSGGYELLNLRLGWNKEVRSWTFAPFLGLQNLTNARYDGTVRLNAFGGRFYEPAAGFNVYGGLQIERSLS